MIRAIRNTIIVEPINPPRTTASGLALPETMTKETTKRGKIVSVGDGKPIDATERQTVPYKVGQTIIYNIHRPCRIDKADYHFVQAGDVLGVER